MILPFVRAASPALAAALEPLLDPEAAKKKGTGRDAGAEASGPGRIHKEGTRRNGDLLLREQEAGYLAQEAGKKVRYRPYASFESEIAIEASGELGIPEGSEDSRKHPLTLAGQIAEKWESGHPCNEIKWEGR